MGADQEEFQLNRPLSLIWIVAIGLLAIVVSAVWFIGSPPDGRQIFGEYANQFRAGHGLVFNPGQPVLLVSAPAYLLLLGVIGTIIPFNIQDIAWLLHVAALAVSAVSIFRIARRAGLSQVISGLIATLSVLAWPIGSGIETPYPIMAALSLLALDLALGSRWRIAGLVFCLAVLCSPEAIIPAVLIFVFAVNNKAGRHYGLSLIIPLVLALIGLRLYYGPALWDGLLIFRFLPSLNPPILEIASILLLGLAFWGWYRQRTNPALALCGAWVGLYLVIVGVVLGAPANYHFAPIAGPVTLLAIVGAREVRIKPAIAYALVTAVYVVITFILSTTTYDYFGPYSSTVKDDKSIGVPSLSTALRLRSSADQVFVALNGELQPDVKAMIERSDIQSILVRYAPDVMYVGESGKINADTISSFGKQLSYRQTDQPGFYKRSIPIGTFVDQPVNIPYGPDIWLVGLALDQPSLRLGQLLRVRLDWELPRPADRPVTVDLQLTADNKTLAQARDEFAPSVFQAGRWSTYHTLTLADNAQPGSLALNVAVIVNDGTIARVPVVTLNATDR